MASPLSTLRQTVDVAVVLALGLVYVCLLTVGTLLAGVARRLPAVRSAGARVGGRLRRLRRSAP